METEKQAINRVNALTQEQRDAAYNAARSRIAGTKPTPTNEPTIEAYQKRIFDKYPPEFIANMRRIAYVVMLAAFVPSALRIFIASFEMSAKAIPSMAAAVLVGFMSILLAEAGQVAFTLWASTTQERNLKIALWVGALGCTAFALTANLQVVQPWINNYVISWIEALLPPTLVLIAAHVLKTQSLHAIENRFAAFQAWTNAHADWERNNGLASSSWNAAYANANASPDWTETLANSLRDALRAANRQSKAVLRELSNADWHALVMRERKAEEWWTDAVQELADAEAQRIADAARLRLEFEQQEQRLALEEQNRLRLLDSGSVSTGPTGEVANAKLVRKGAMYVRECPECKKKFEGDTERKATNKLVAHMRVHVRERRAFALTNVPATEEDTEPVAQTA